MFVAAAAGAKVSKHGGRSVSSKSGSADVMEALGVNINLTPEAIAQCIAKVGVGFMFAPNHHPAMKNVAPVRKELGVRTIFNLLGPLTNPASAPNILMGVFHPDLVGIQVRALQRLGAEHAVVVYGRDGMDEVSLGAATMVGELRNGEINEYEIHPEDFGMVMASNRALKVETAEQSKVMLLGVLDNELKIRLKTLRAFAGVVITTGIPFSLMETYLKQKTNAIGLTHLTRLSAPHWKSLSRSTLSKEIKYGRKSFSLRSLNCCRRPKTIPKPLKSSRWKKSPSLFKSE
jgi:anthranilate phosphoribosyltransferase